MVVIEASLLHSMRTQFISIFMPAYILVGPRTHSRSEPSACLANHKDCKLSAGLANQKTANLPVLYTRSYGSFRKLGGTVFWSPCNKVPLFSESPIYVLFTCCEEFQVLGIYEMGTLGSYEPRDRK